VGKKKLIRFAENFTFDHLFQQSYSELMKGFPLKGKWRSGYFLNDHPITLELGCGKGEYAVGLARMFPRQNFIGVDIKGARLWKGCKTVQEEDLKNVAFIRTKIEMIEQFFGNGEVDEIWLTFPDPRPKKIDRKKRLVSPEFLKRYSSIMRKNGIVHLKTDNRGLFDYALEILEETGQELLFVTTDLYNSGFEGPASSFRTFYEEKFLKENIKINYLQFKFNPLNG
jgi:tRNA (guanine-N7-)-methyltransferase